MTLISCLGRHALRCNNTARLLRSSLSIRPNVPSSLAQRRCFQSCTARLAGEGEEQGKRVIDSEFWKEFKGSYEAPTPTFRFDHQIPLDSVVKQVTATGFLESVVIINKNLCFAQLTSKGSGNVQILCKDMPEKAKLLKSTRPHSAVSFTGTLGLKNVPKGAMKENRDTADEGYALLSQVEITLEEFKCLNSFPDDIAVNASNDTAFNYPPESRHLQIRFDTELKDRLRFRSEVAAYAREQLSDFQEIETPILFKSTPEGAREFLVPTRKMGYAYALPQSPQQYKQILMASGVNRYFQFAKCFRDEDLRADRQPEFTQVDLEMAWTDGEGVMRRVEKLIKSLYQKFAKPGTPLASPLPDIPFLRMSYDEAMSKHGSDKPDLRIKGLIHQVDDIAPNELRSMLTSLEDPIIEVCKLRLDGQPRDVGKFVSNFMDSPEAEVFRRNPDGAPGFAIFDSRRPLEGLQTFGYDGAEKLKDLYSQLPPTPTGDQDVHEAATEFDDGDLFIIQARKNLPHSGGSTVLGKLRLAMYKAAIAEGLVSPDPTHHYLWVTGFPMFTPSNDIDPGQGGASGFSATHHPFTAPKTTADIDLLLADPLKAVADHYDLVVNGVELGGGSRRIHNAEMQKFIMRDILKMSEERMNDFSHLFEALRAGCPPHAGLAIGFDRLIAVMTGRESVKDVIAFPKSSKGEDMMVKSPSRITEGELRNYHLKLVGERKDVEAELVPEQKAIEVGEQPSKP